MTIGATASPLCTWLFAAYMSTSVAGFADDIPVSSAPSGRPSGRIRRRNASSKRLAGASWSVKTDVQSRAFSNVCLGAPCASGIAGLGSYLAFESCPEDDSFKNESLAGDVSFFGAGLPALRTKLVQSVRRPVKASAGEEHNLALLWLYSLVCLLALDGPVVCAWLSVIFSTSYASCESQAASCSMTQSSQVSLVRGENII